MAALHFLITGRVQGVGFRYAMCIEARRLGLSGWVRNRRDGSVEAVAVGEEAVLGLLTQWARRGPAASEVQRVDVKAIADADLPDIDQPFAQRADA